MAHANLTKAPLLDLESLAEWLRDVCLNGAWVQRLAVYQFECQFALLVVLENGVHAGVQV